MNRFIQDILGFSLKHRGFILVMTGVLVLAGTFSYLNTPIEAFPDVTNTRVQIITQWPGRSAEEVEKFVTIPIEVEMNAVPKKSSLRSISLFGLSVVTIIFDDNVQEFEARQQVAIRLTSAEIPDGVEPDVQPPSGPTGEIFRYTLTSPKRSVRELKTLQDWVLDRQLKSVPGVADVVSFGGEVKTYEVSVDPNALAKYNITALDVFQAITQSNVNVGGDVITRNDQSYVVRGLGLVTNIPQIENIIVENNAGVPVYIKNVAQVREACLPQLGYVGRDSLDNQLEGIVLMRLGENPGAVLSALQAKVAELNDRVLPADTRISTFYDRTTLIEHTTHTVKDNLLHGVLLVTALVLLFMLDWRATVCVAVVIPLALLFAFVCLRLRGMSANLLSMGAIDFGIIIDGAVVMVEGLFVVLDRKAREVGMERFNKLAKLSLIKRNASQAAKSIFFAKIIIITALLPIFAFQKVEGKMFSPLAFTLGFALLGAMIVTLTLVPVLVSYLLSKNVHERHNRFVELMKAGVMNAFQWCRRNKWLSVGSAAGTLVLSLVGFTQLGTEFLPHLNEGSVYIRASMPLSASLESSIKMSNRIRHIFDSFEEVNQVISQAGRPNDGTDPTGFFNIELFVDLKPKEEWKRDISKEALIDEMKARLSGFQGINFNFSQPISDNVEEAVSGVKGSLAVKVYGTDPVELTRLGVQIRSILENVRGVEDLGLVGLIGQPELRIQLDQNRMALYGVTTLNCQTVVEMAIGGKNASVLYEGERRFAIRIRYQPGFRDNERVIGDLLVPTVSGAKVPLKSISEISYSTGLAFLYRENNQRFIAVKFSVRGRDLGGTIAEAQQSVNAQIHLPRSMHMEWRGDFENQVRATNRLAQVVPISIGLIFLILFVLFGNMRDAGLTLLNVPFALIGGIMALALTGINFSISAGIGFIALFGVCVQNGVILISVFQHNLAEKKPLAEAISSGVSERVRPVVMTALMASLGMLPAALSTGIGSETQKPLAIVVIGGLITATILTLLVFPLIVESVYRRFPETRKRK